MPGKVSAQERAKRFVFLLHREWEILRRNPDYVADVNKFRKGYWSDPVNFLKEFRRKYYISPINPERSFAQIYDTWLSGKGWDMPFRLEPLYRKAEKNFPIFRERKTQGHLVVRIVDTKPDAYSWSDIVDALDAILDNAGIKGSKSKLIEKPFVNSPTPIGNEIRLLINRNATKSSIRSAILNMLKREDFSSKKRQAAREVFKRQMTVYDYIKAHPKMTFIEVGRNLHDLFPKKMKPSEREKACHADFTEACKMIGIHRQKKEPKRDTFEMKTVSLSDEALDNYLAKIKLGKRPPKKSPKTWDRNGAYEPSHATIFDSKQYSQEFLRKLIDPVR